MKEQRKEENNLEIKDVVDKTEDFIVKNQRIIIVVVAAILIVILGYFGIKKLYLEPKERDAAEVIFGAENHFDAGEYELALNGDGKFEGFIDIIDQYSSTKSGNLAKYYAGISSLKLGRFDDAVSYLKSYKGKDLFTKNLALIALGDAYLELNDMNKAIEYYKKGAADKKNEITASYALFKLGIAYVSNQDAKNALVTFKEIKEKFPNTAEGREIDKYIALAESL